VDGLAQEWNGRVQVVRVNVHDSENRPLLTRLGFRVTPTFILFDADGQEVWRATGIINPAEANRIVDSLD
jgi:thiol-disulfide isomerase/thioredoxin